MTYANNTTGQLWQSFMPRRNEIQNRVNEDFINLQIYDPTFNFNQFDFHKPFDKWASVEVSDFSYLPAEMETFIIPSGLYAVFNFKGSVKDAPAAFMYIFNTWLPASQYNLDHRPHFEILGEKYKKNDPSSEEEIWIPVKLKDN